MTDAGCPFLGEVWRFGASDAKSLAICDCKFWCAKVLSFDVDFLKMACVMGSESCEELLSEDMTTSACCPSPSFPVFSSASCPSSVYLSSSYYSCYFLFLLLFFILYFAFLLMFLFYSYVLLTSFLFPSSFLLISLFPSSLSYDISSSCLLRLLSFFYYVCLILSFLFFDVSFLLFFVSSYLFIFSSY